ncbi:MAG: UDP-N-acetylmuramate--L-alanine ligase [Planctomycetota bacterium]
MDTILNKIQSGQVVYFIGIGGIGMSGLVQCLQARGIKVAGSDLTENDAVTRLRQQGCPVFIGHNAENLPLETALVIKSAAIKDDNPELRETQKRRLPVLKYAQLLGELMKTKYGIAVSGCHGKTTTTAFISYVLQKNGRQPSFVVGGYVPSLKTSARAGRGKYFVAEACEFDRSFHNLWPKILVINNIEADHLDYYRDLDEIIESFQILADKVPVDGFILVNQDDKNALQAIQFVTARVITYGLTKAANWQAKNIRLKNNRWFFEVWHRSKNSYKKHQKFGNFVINIPGKHNVHNTLAVIVTAHLLGISKTDIKKNLTSFTGVARRFEIIGRLKPTRPDKIGGRRRGGKVTVIDDYAHHPTEIAVVLKTARRLWPKRKIWCVFQPHQYSRTRCFLDEFALVFSGADMTIVPDIYFSRDSAQARKEVTAQDLVKKIKELKGQAIYLATFDKIISYLNKNMDKADIIITMGAGDIGQVAQALVKYNRPM